MKKQTEEILELETKLKQLQQGKDKDNVSHLRQASGAATTSNEEVAKLTNQIHEQKKELKTLRNQLEAGGGKGNVSANATALTGAAAKETEEKVRLLEMQLRTSKKQREEDQEKLVALENKVCPTSLSPPLL